MNELVHSLHSKLISILHLPSFAGDGLSERMRSTSFALLGLIAAAGLALVAIFAQPDFSLISPAPLPAEPSIGESIGNAKRLPLDHGPVAIVPALPAAASPVQRKGSSVEAPSGGVPSHSSSPAQGQAAPTEVAAPPPAGAPAPSGGKSAGGAGNGTGGDPSPAPAAVPQPATTSPPATSSPPPSNPKPEAIASAPKPEPVAAPGNSSSAAAAEHASERGIEASAGSGPPSGTPTTASSAPEDSGSPGNGNGLAKGHYK